MDRMLNASTVNAFVAEAARMGLKPELRARVSAPVAAIIDRPPLATSRIPGAYFDEMYQAVVDSAGRDVLRAISLGVMRSYTGPLLRRLIENTLTNNGTRSPAVLFAQFGFVAEPLTKGLHFTWTPQTETSGFMELRPLGQPTALTYVSWEGIIEYFVEACGAKGVVEHAIVAPDLLSARFPIRWDSIA